MKSSSSPSGNHPFRRPASLAWPTWLLVAGCFGAMSGLRPSPLSVDAGLVADAASPAPAVIAEDLPGNPCRLTADLLVRTDEPGGIRFDGRVRSIGRSIVSLRVLQASWRGPYRLRSIELDGKVVATGLGSPALVSLGGPEGMAVAPGTSQTLVLYFVPDPDAAPELFALGPVLFLSEDGCAQLLGESAAIDFVHNAFVHLKAIGFTAEAQPLLDKAGVVADAGIVALTGAAEAFLPPARTRQWDRESKVRLLA